MVLKNEGRKLLENYYQKTHNTRKTAEVFGVSRETVRRINKRYEETGTTDLQTSTRGRKPTITAEIEKQIKDLVLKHPDITASEIIEQLGLSVTDGAIYQHLRKMGFTRKKKALYAAERNRLRCSGKKKSMGK